MSELAISVTGTPSPDDIETIGSRLTAFNETDVGPADRQPLAVLVRNEAGARIHDSYPAALQPLKREAQHVTGGAAQATNDYLVGQMVHAFANHPDNPYHCPSGAFNAPSWRFWRNGQRRRQKCV